MPGIVGSCRPSVPGIVTEKENNMKIRELFTTLHDVRLKIFTEDNTKLFNGHQDNTPLALLDKEVTDISFDEKEHLFDVTVEDLEVDDFQISDDDYLVLKDEIEIQSSIIPSFYTLHNEELADAFFKRYNEENPIASMYRYNMSQYICADNIARRDLTERLKEYESKLRTDLSDINSLLKNIQDDTFNHPD